MRICEEDLKSMFVDFQGTKMIFKKILKDDGDGFNLEMQILNSLDTRLYNIKGIRYIRGKLFNISKKLSKEENPEYFL